MSQNVIGEIRKQGGPRNRLGPIRVCFEHGVVNKDVFSSFQVSEFGYSFAGTDKSGRKKQQPQMNVALEYDRFTYRNNVGWANERPVNPYQKTLLAIRDLNTNRICLIESNDVVLSPDVQAPASTNPFLMEEERRRESRMLTDDQVRMEQVRAQNKKLVSEFGLAKKRRTYEQIDRIRVSAETTENKLKGSALEVSEEALLLPSEEQSVPLTPPCNRMATKVEDVYQMEDIISSEELDQLLGCVPSLCAEFSSEEDIRSKMASKKITAIFGEILLRQLEVKNERQIAAAIYIEAILQFLRMNARNLSKGAKGLPAFVPLGLRLKVFNTFAPEMRISQENNDRALCYALILALLVNNFVVEFSHLSSSVKMRQEHLKKLVAVTGASLQSDRLSGRNFILLKLPLANFNMMGSSRKSPGKRR